MRRSIVVLGILGFLFSQSAIVHSQSGSEVQENEAPGQPGSLAKPESIGVPVLFNAMKDPVTGKERVEFLWPLGVYEMAPDKKIIRFIPLFDYSRREEAPDQQRVRYLAVPGIIGGSAPETGKYLAVFPWGGELKNFFGREDVKFFLWPAYITTRDEGRQRRTVLWPIFYHARGGGERAFRLWPFYGQKIREGKSEQRFLLWPVFHWQRSDLDTERPGKALFVFPFYAHMDNSRFVLDAVLWPLFLHLDNTAAQYEQWNAPWPFFSRTTGTGKQELQLWPFWGHLVRGQKERYFAMWPLIWTWREAGEDEAKFQTKVVPFYDAEVKRSDQTEPESVYKQIWPFYTYTKDDDGKKTSTVLSLVPYRDRTGVIDRNYGPLWRLYRHSVSPDGSESTSLLWGTVLYERERDAKSLRLLYIPKRIRW